MRRLHKSHAAFNKQIVGNFQLDIGRELQQLTAVARDRHAVALAGTRRYINIAALKVNDLAVGHRRIHTADKVNRHSSLIDLECQIVQADEAR